MIPLAMTGLWLLGAALAGPLVVGNAFRAAFGDAAVARRELRRFPALRIADVTAGPVRLTGQVVAVEPSLPSPIGGTDCVFYQLRLRKLGVVCRNVVYPNRPVTFALDDGTGRALIRVPPPPPPPEPGDETPWEVVCAIGGQGSSRLLLRGESEPLDRIYDQADGHGGFLPVRVSEGIIAAGDVVSIGGFASTEIAADSRAASYRALPTRVALTSAAGYRLALVK
jgi:hypothetical protein